MREVRENTNTNTIVNTSKNTHTNENTNTNTNVNMREVRKKTSQILSLRISMGLAQCIYAERFKLSYLEPGNKLTICFFSLV